MVKGRKIYKRCSVKGCRKKVALDGKCSVHSRKKPVEVRSEKKAPSHSLRHIARKIKKVKKTHEGLHRKVKKTALYQEKSFLNALSFEAGAAAGKLKRLIEG